MVLSLCVLLIFGSCELYASTSDHKVKIAFVINELSFRGIEVSTFDYADYNEKILGNESIIINFDVNTDNDVRKKFCHRFSENFFDCTSLEELDYVLVREQVDILYYQKPGHNDGVVSKVCKNAVHAVFPQKIEPHGDVYAYISEWFTKEFPDRKLPYVPYMVRVDSTTENLRESLKIPENALVFGRHGGATTFNVPSAQQAVIEVARTRPEIYFLFLNTQEFCQEPNVIFLPKTTDMAYKAKFINSCDAMIHARWRGETFGLACAEFSVKNKPIISWAEPKERAHIAMLGSNARYFSSKKELVDILLSFKKEPYRNWDFYSQEYSPEMVMKKFDEVFIQPLISKSTKKPIKKLMYTPCRTADNSINPIFIKRLKKVFDEPIIIHESDDYQLNSSLLTLPKRLLFFIDCVWHAAMTRELSLPSIFNQVNTLLSQTHKTIFIIDKIRAYEDPSFEDLYYLLKNHGYRCFVNNSTLIAFTDEDVFTDQLIRAMTLSTLSIAGIYKNDAILHELLFAEHTIGRLLCDPSLQEEFTYAISDSYLQQLWLSLRDMHTKDYEKAAHRLRGIINVRNVHWRLYWYLGQALYQLGSIEAEDFMLKVINTVPQFPGIVEFKKNISA